MTEIICVGATIGFVALVLLDELDLKLCRLCLCFWLSVFYCVFWGDWIWLGAENIVAHLSYLLLHKAANYVPNSSIPGGH